MSHEPGRVLARWIAGAPRRWNETALAGARRAFIDTMACALGGAADAAVRRTLTAVGPWGRGAGQVLGGGPRLPAPWAALVNGTAAHALDYDDVIEVAAAHVSAVLVPALMALGEERGADGATCLDAYLVGFEVMARLAEAVNMVHYFRGWHTTLTLGAPAAAAACARLLGLDAERALAAVSLATSMASGLKRQFGTMAKPVHAGLAAKNGVLAACLAEAGITAAADVLEGERGFVDLFAAAGRERLDGAVGRLGAPSAMIQHGVWVKFYPCCASLHRPLDAVLALRSEYGFEAGAVAGIRARISQVAAQNLPYRQPANEMEARFSLPFAVAAAVLDGEAGLATFAPEAVGRDDVRALIPRIEVEADAAQPGTARAGATRDWATIEVRLADGRTLTRTVHEPLGHACVPLTDDQLARKFRACARRALPAAQVEKALDLLGDLARLPALADLTRHLATEGASTHVR